MPNHTQCEFVIHSFAPRSFEDPVFTSSFTQSFLDFALSREADPNVRFSNSTTNVTPRWARYTAASDRKFEMVFNRTAGGPDIHPTTTDAGLLERCACVLLCFATSDFVDNNRLTVMSV